VIEVPDVALACAVYHTYRLIDAGPVDIFSQKIVGTIVFSNNLITVIDVDDYALAFGGMGSRIGGAAWVERIVWGRMVTARAEKVSDL
jgi:hypothetical protein